MYTVKAGKNMCICMTRANDSLSIRVEDREREREREREGGGLVDEKTKPVTESLASKTLVARAHARRKKVFESTIPRSP
jgi:hypothetical protein